jgi:CRISPR-associated protein Csm2
MSVGSRGPGQPGRPGPPGGQRPGGPGGGFRPGGQRGEEFRPPSESELRAIIQEGDADKLVSVAENLGRILARPPDQLTTSQIRAIFGAVREIEMRWPPGAQPRAEEDTHARRSHRELLLLKPKLAYQAARAQAQRSQGVTHLQQVLSPAIDLVGTNRERFQNFVEFFEAILAYHRAHGGRE